MNSRNKKIGYNITIGGNQISSTPEIAKKISISMKNNFKDPIKGKQLRDSLSRTHKGKKLSTSHINSLKRINHERVRTAEEKQKISNKLIGHKPFGNFLSDDTKEKISQSSKNRHWFNNGIKEVFTKECPYGFVKGRLPYSNSWKDNISKASSNRIFSKETREKISESKIGENNPQYGKVGTIKGKICINNGIKNKYISPECFENFVKLGWKRGKLLKERRDSR